MSTLCSINLNSTRQSNNTRRTFINDRLLGPIEISQCIRGDRHAEGHSSCIIAESER